MANGEEDINGSAEEIVNSLGRNDLKAIVAFTKAILNQNKMVKVIVDNSEDLVNVFDKEDGAFNKKIANVQTHFDDAMTNQTKSIKDLIETNSKIIVLSIIGAFVVIAAIFGFIVNVIATKDTEEIVKAVIEALKNEMAK